MRNSASTEFRAVLVDGRMYEKKHDGTLVLLEGKTDWPRVDAMTDEEVTANAESDPDARPYTDDEWAEVEFIERPAKVPVGLKLDADVHAWFKSRGRGYQTRINAVLRRYIEAQERRVGVAAVPAMDAGGVPETQSRSTRSISSSAWRPTMPSKRELIDTGTDKRYVRRDEKGQFKESDDVGRSLSQDIRRKAKTTVKSGQGDRGDQKKG